MTQLARTGSPVEIPPAVEADAFDVSRYREAEEYERSIGAGDRPPSTPVATLDLVPSQVALLDSEALILAVNHPWIRSGTANDYSRERYGVGGNYLEACERADEAGAEEAPLVAQAIRDVLSGAHTSIAVDYSCPAADGPRWFRVTVTLVPGGEKWGALVSHADVTEPKLAELALHRVQRQHDLALGAAGVATWYGDGATKRIVWDTHTHRIFGLEPSAAPPTLNAWFALVHADDREGAEQEFLRAIEARRPCYVEFRMLWPDGSEHWVASRCEMHRDAETGEAHIFGACWEITERRRAEDGLARGLAVEQLLTTISARLSRFSDENFGAEIHSILGLLADFVGVDAMCFGVLLDGSKWEVEQGWTRDTGSAGPLLAICPTAIPWSEGLLEHQAVVQIADIAQLPATALAERACLAALGFRAAMAVPLMKGDALFGILGCAQREARAGWRDDEILLLRLAGEMILSEELRHHKAQALAALALVGRELITLVDAPAILERVCQLTAAVLPCDAAAVLEVPVQGSGYVAASQHGFEPTEWDAIQRLHFPPGCLGPNFAELPTGEVMRVDSAGEESPAALLQGRFGFSTGLYVDLISGSEITGLLAAFRRDGTAFGPHETRIVHGVAQLASFALANARLVAELGQANQVKSDFIATMSHELRTPLNIVLGYADLLLEKAFGPLNQEQEHTLRRIGRSGRSLHQMVEATLSVARIDAGENGLEESEVEPTALLAAVEEATAELCDNPALRFTWHAQADLPALRTDAGKLMLVLRNLVENAAKFTDAGEVRVVAEAAEGGVCFRVTDTGIGIAPALLPIIFDSFRQGDSSNTRKYGGVGLGLYIVRRLLELMGGRIDVASVEGSGSTFSVWMPLGASSPPPGREGTTTSLSR